jgi:SAM-dependent methyltransferase
MGRLAELDAHEVPVFETFVVPRFLSMFGVVAMEMLIPCERAVIANVGCRTGFPDQVIGRVLPGCTVVGFDASDAALELARTKSALIRDVIFDYRLEGELPLGVPDGSFSHALAIYPLVDQDGRFALVHELRRVLAEGGQALLALPLRGSYQELADLLREFALKHEAPEVARAADAAGLARPTIETLSEVLEECGLEDADVDVRPMTLTYKSGRDFFEDPSARLLVLPELEMLAGTKDLAPALDYVRDAIDRYWSEGEFELSINVGCASARRFE